MLGCSVKRYDYKNCNTNYSKNNYKLDINTITNFINKNIDKNDIEFIKENLQLKSLKYFFENEFIEYHRKQYKNCPIYFK